MEPSKLGNAYGASSSDEGIDAASLLFAGLSVDVDAVISPMKPVFHGTENQFSELLESMRQMRALQNDAEKQVFQIPHKKLFINALKSVGILDPVIRELRYKGSFQVHIQFSSDLPICTLAGSKHVKIVGDFYATHELAEASAIIKAFAHLSKTNNVVLVDISYRKEASLLQTSRYLYGNATDGLRMVDFMLQKWRKCFDVLYEVERFAYLKMKPATSVESTFARPIYQALQYIKRVSMVRNRSFDAKLKCLTVEKDNHVEAARLKPFINKASIQKAYFHDVDALALLLQWLNLEDAQYATSPSEDGLFLGVVALSFPLEQNMVPPGDMAFEARDPKKTIAKAYNAAAREAIFYLEMHFNVEVAGLNYSGKVEAEQEMFVWKGLNEEACLLGANVLKFWEDMLEQVEGSIQANKSRPRVLATQASADGKKFIDDLLARFELAAANCTRSFKVAAAKFASLK